MTTTAEPDTTAIETRQRIARLYGHTDAPHPSGVTELALIDLSSIAYPIWLMSGTQPDPDYTSTQIVSRVRALTANHPHAAVCCDKGKSFRCELDSQYKATREKPANMAALLHQIAIAKERLEADGYPVWACSGFEADDLIATATAIALGVADTTVLVMSADKDLLQLVGPRVKVMSTASGTIYDEGAVWTKFGVRPSQMRDYLALVGDASDNIKGAHRIGPKTAADLLARFGTLKEIYRNLNEHATQFKPAIATSLREFETRAELTCSLVTLRTDCEIPFLEIDNPRTPKDTAPMEGDDMDERAALIDIAADAPQSAPGESVASAATPPAASADSVSARLVPNGGDSGQSHALAVREPDVLAPPPIEWEKQLEPRSLTEAQRIATSMFNSRLFSGYGSPAAVLSTVLAGRELGLPAIASLRGIHVVEGRHMLAADLLRALVMRSGLAKYFRCAERTPERATFETHRKDDPGPIALTYTIEEAIIAGVVKPKSGWEKNPADMLVARASSKLARLVYPEVVHGLYCPEEID